MFSMCQRLQEDMEKTKNEKEEAVMNQKFEKAATLRDKQKELKEKFNFRKMNDNLEYFDIFWQEIADKLNVDYKFEYKEDANWVAGLVVRDKEDEFIKVGELILQILKNKGLIIDDEYETKFYECFGLSDRNELKEHIKGEVRINGKIQEFTFKGEDHFEWIEFGNNYDTDNGGWIVAGEFGLVLNPKIIKFSVVSIDGDTFPADINKLTFSPVEDNAINL